MKRTLLAVTAATLAFCGTASAQDADCPARLRAGVDYLSSERLQGRGAGTEGERLAAEYVYDRMSEAGVIMLSGKSGQDFSIVRGGDTLSSLNIVGMVEGYDPELKHEYIVVGANLDHIGVNRIIRNGVTEDQYIPGADNNASGVACLVELARRVAWSSFAFKRSVVFVAFGAGREGFAGSWYFLNRGPFDAEDISMMLNLNMVGRQGRESPLSYCTAVPNAELTLMTGEVCRDLLMPVMPQITGQIPSADYLPFYEKGVPVMLLTTGVHQDMYSMRDEPSRLNYDYMETVCEFSYSLLLKVAGMDGKVVRSAAPSLPSQADIPDPDKVWSPYEVDRAPQFYHSDEKEFLQRWVYEYLHYPEDAVRLGIQGQVIVEFIVEKDGTVTNVRAVKAADPDLAEEALKVVSVSPKWKPALLNGEKVRVRMTVPVEFRLKKR